MRISVGICAGVVTATLVWFGGNLPVVIAASMPVVPGTGELVTGVGDDFEDPEWKYIPNSPKSSGEQDGRRRAPFGHSANGRWIEGDGRGQPDLVKRIETPPGGLEGSTGALWIASQFTGIPGMRTAESTQDDLFMIVAGRVGGIPVSKSPSAVVRVFVPAFDQWEDRTGSSFAFRATLRGSKFGESETEPYWPGLFFNFNSGHYRQDKKDSAYLVVRSGPRGEDYKVRNVTETGWWTLGMSFTPDGRVHYYAHPGIADLTSADHLASHHCYGFRALQLKQVFFDVWNLVDGQHWSTGWVIDDPKVFVVGQPPQLVRQNLPKNGKTR